MKANQDLITKLYARYAILSDLERAEWGHVSLAVGLRQGQKFCWTPYGRMKIINQYLSYDQKKYKSN